MTATTPRSVAVPTPADLDWAASVVAGQLRPTPLLELPVPGAGAVLAKLETVQPTGSFKPRGALAALAGYAAAGRRVIASSAGNHGLGVAFAAARLGVPATIVVPRKASRAKVETLRELGADLVQHGNGYEEAERYALELAGDGAVFVSPYNDRYVLAGQASCAAEILADVEGDCTLLVPVGGGALLGGSVLRARGRPGVRVVGVEAAASPALSTSVARAGDVTVPVGDTLADGLAGNMEPGSVTREIAASGVHAFVSVTEPEIAAAIRFLATRCGLVVEGSGAVGIAALMAGKVAVHGTPVTILSGRNIAADTLAGILGG